MKIAVALTVAVLSLGATAVPTLAPEPAPAAKPVQIAQNTTCFFKREETSGMNKICYYDCLGSLTAITIGSAQLCPLTIKR